MINDCSECGGSGEVVIGCATDSPLTAPCPSCSAMPRRWCAVHNREEFKYESLEHELRTPSPSVREAAEAPPAVTEAGEQEKI